jgi:hypothetical protein
MTECESNYNNNKTHCQLLVVEHNKLLLLKINVWLYRCVSVASTITLRLPTKLDTKAF